MTERQPDRAIGTTTAFVLAVMCMFIWGSPPTVSRAVSGEVPPVALSLSRWLIALLVLLPFVARKLPGEWARLKSNWRSFSSSV